MSVYVDDMRASYGRLIMCHMGADTTEELLAMADKIGVQRKWLQHAGTRMEHFDIALSKRTLAVQHGAIEVSQRGFVLRKNPELAAKVLGPICEDGPRGCESYVCRPDEFGVWRHPKKQP